MPIIITRGNNVYGPNQYPEKLIPKFIKLLKENKKLQYKVMVNQLEDFYIIDTMKAFECILNKGKIGRFITKLRGVWSIL